MDKLDPILDEAKIMGSSAIPAAMADRNKMIFRSVFRASTVISTCLTLIRFDNKGWLQAWDSVWV
jgi:hypothetical protein